MVPEPPRPADTRPLTERRRPAHLAQLLGNARAVRELRAWATAWQSSPGVPPRLRAALLDGPPGVGKTTCALALAADMGWSVVEMNASDARNEQAITAVAGRASLTNTLGDTGEYLGTKGGGRTLILLDEADCLTGRASEEAASRPAAISFREFLRGRYGTTEALAKAWQLGGPGVPPAFAEWGAVPTTAGRGAWTRLPAAQRDLADWRSSGKPRDASDRGGLGAIARLVRETRQPLLLTVNDPKPLQRYSAVFKQGVALVHFYPVEPTRLGTALRRIATEEHYQLGAGVLEAILARSQGDVRAALTDLEAVGLLPGEVGKALLLGRRDLASDYYEFTRELLGAPRYYRAVEVRERLDVTPDDLFPWMEENIPRAAADAAHRWAAVSVLAQAEHLLARARRERVWALWSFASELMTGGAAMAATPGARSVDLSFSSFLGEMGRTRGVRATRTAVAAKVGSRLHVSRRKAIEAVFPFLDRIFVTSERDGTALAELRRSIARQLGLTNEEFAFLTGGDVDAVDLSEPETATASPAAPPAPAEPTPAGPTTAAAEPVPRQVQRKLAEF